ncbi:pentapeptide repeat-containing protein [Streptosporangium carneum]|nr:pentapeptide repeat-containing protein [Streptosporangium carneum]
MPITLLVGGVVGGVAWLLLAAGWSAAEATIRQGAVQTALAAGAGVGAAITLMLAFRRQRHQEHTAHVTAYLAERNAALAEQVADNTKYDATERRVTDLYTKAAEQLGHDKAAVRLAGLYALERLAQDNPPHRQTIINLICAYLRMPYTPPKVAHAPNPERDRKVALRAARRRHQAARAGILLLAEPASRQESGGQEGELQVRLTAQRILSVHLRDDRPADQPSTLPAAPAFWEGMSLDLTGATLIDFNLTNGRVTDAGFERAVFYEDTVFRGTAFTGAARFYEATFREIAWFDKATFAEVADFVRATFCKHAGFDKATFAETARFGEVTFAGEAGFRMATFRSVARFEAAAFTEDAWFFGATFAERAWFDKVIFAGNVWSNRMVVVDPAAAHVWPDGWRLETTPDGTSHLAQEEVGSGLAQNS